MAARVLALGTVFLLAACGRAPGTFSPVVAQSNLRAPSSGQSSTSQLTTRLYVAVPATSSVAVYGMPLQHEDPALASISTSSLPNAPTPFGVAVDATNLYVSAKGTISNAGSGIYVYGLPIAGGEQPQFMVQAGTYPIALTAAGGVLYMLDADAQTLSAFALPLTPGATPFAIEYLPTPYHLAADGKFVYVQSFGSNNTESLYAYPVPLTSGQPATILSLPPGSAGVAIQDDDLYVANALTESISKYELPITSSSTPEATFPVNAFPGQLAAFGSSSLLLTGNTSVISYGLPFASGEQSQADLGLGNTPSGIAWGN